MSEYDDMLVALDKIRAFVLRQKQNNTNLTEDITKLDIVGDDSFEKIKGLLESKEWPQAVNPALIVGTNEENKIEQAEGILDFLVDRSVSGKRFLDYGCGEGHTAKVAATTGAIKSVGYNSDGPVDAEPWKDLDENGQKSGYILTNDFDIVRKNSPYDIVLSYGSIEQSSKDMLSSLMDIKSVTSPHGIIVISFQPWIGRYGGNLYREINKAFIHAIFTEEELNKLNLPHKNKKKVYFPMATYRDLIKKADLKIVSERVEKEPVEGFFERHAILRDRLKNMMPENSREKFPRHQMEQCAVEYVLTL